MYRRIGILTAMAEEFRGIERRFGSTRTHEIGPRTFYSLAVGDLEIVLVHSRIGKVAAASTVTTLFDRFDVDAILFTGVAGGVAHGVGIGDIVVGDRLIQHDLDLKGVLGYSRFEIPLIGESHIKATPHLVDLVRGAAEEVVTDPQYRDHIAAFTEHYPRVHVGIVGSGDQFVNDLEHQGELLEAIPGLLCVEMEGAAVAQVCHERNIPFVVARIISDSADEHAPVDFGRFVTLVASHASEALASRFIERIAAAR